PDGDGVIRIDLAIAEESIQQRAVLYDKQGDAHFDTISAFIKSVRGSDADAALFWLARMVEAGENPRFIFRRMLIAAGEDVGLADPNAMVVVEACAAAFDRVGLPEGLYPLAHAALYLAATEKSNSSLGFFDALRSVREAADQRVPPHLRDANRDGKAFGDGVGYRYPHAYAEHWVAQQYLPSALQGEVFWQPGPLGWEGALRGRLQQRRAAQLAAAAESELDQPELLSSAPEDPQLERWLRRQAAAEGERLEGLRQRFWQPPLPGRLDRVLVLEARSLLWALDPLQQAREGEVVIAVSDQEQLARLEAQLQILDQLQRPRLLVVPPHQLGALEQQLGPPPAAGRFEWVVARQPLRGCSAAEITAWLEALEPWLSADGELRVLFSRPLLGPCGSLRQGRERGRRIGPAAAAAGVADAAGGSDQDAAVIALEQRWLEAEHREAQHLGEALMARGWNVTEQSWQETLSLTLAPPLLERWFAPEAAYRRWLEPQIGASAFGRLQARLGQALGSALPQPLQHTWIQARRRPATGMAPRPRTRRQKKAPD
ncbi:MAG: AAA family ATPase, partial [Cyanobacteriota bacterium]|nr:AAA family ATPase [Cyanobacteriota bacterium]